MTATHRNPSLETLATRTICCVKKGNEVPPPTLITENNASVAPRTNLNYRLASLQGEIRGINRTNGFSQGTLMRERCAAGQQRESSGNGNEDHFQRANVLHFRMSFHKLLVPLRLLQPIYMCVCMYLYVGLCTCVCACVRIYTCMLHIYIGQYTYIHTCIHRHDSISFYIVAVFFSSSCIRYCA